MSTMLQELAPHLIISGQQQIGLHGQKKEEKEEETKLCGLEVHMDFRRLPGVCEYDQTTFYEILKE